jgi:hypothetical protein
VCSQLGSSAFYPFAPNCCVTANRRDVPHLLGLAGECIGANTAARQQELRLEPRPLEALLGRRMSGELPPTTPHHAATRGRECTQLAGVKLECSSDPEPLLLDSVPE